MFTWTRSIKQWFFGNKANRTIRNRRAVRARSFRPFAEQLEVRLALATVATYDAGTVTFTRTSGDTSAVTITLIADLPDDGVNQVKFNVNATVFTPPSSTHFMADLGDYVTIPENAPVNKVVVNLGPGPATLDIGSDWDFDIPVEFTGSTGTDTLDLSAVGPQNVVANAIGTNGYNSDTDEFLKFTDLNSVVFGGNATDQLAVDLVSASSLDFTYAVTGAGAGILTNTGGPSLSFTGLEAAIDPVHLSVLDSDTLPANPNLGALKVTSDGLLSTASALPAPISLPMAGCPSHSTPIPWPLIWTPRLPM